MEKYFLDNEFQYCKMSILFQAVTINEKSRMKKFYLKGGNYV